VLGKEPVVIATLFIDASVEIGTRQLLARM
jgi:hypothetical protein